ncbi:MULTISPECIES: ABC transporter substrate-binding protein [Metabacillus]|uniref:Sugar ABC transporter substrate-binding protein n=2 Tax=Metabacillus TaxID=2675233 RepID=A0A179TA61_9BACI|nr:MULTISPECIES: extracellular solute-binding protein [Metabacillus]OAS89302.1 sugar ABC transporter substrate-binding protein [Metabacillus litoralis]QNF28815.1 extracellular solute-binding protein [Metabacillus sp. KUDC1714]
MRKKLSFLLVLLLVFAMVGCSSSQSNTTEEDSDGKVTLTLWYWNRSLDDDLLAKVKEEFPNVNLKPQKIDGAEYKTKLQTTLAAGSGAPDIVAMNDWANEFLPYTDQFVNLLDYGADELKDQYLEWKWNYTLTPDNKTLIALPIDTGPTALFYREDIFAKAGLPTDPAEVSAELSTWEDYIEAGEKVEAATGVKMFDSINRVFTQNISQSDSVYFDEEDNFIGDGGNVKKAWDLAVAVHEKGLSANLVDGTEWNAGMNNGEIASFIGAVWTKKILEDAAPDTAGKWRVARAPGGDGNNGGSFIGITKASKHPEEAYEVIKWLMSPENQLQAYTTMDLFPSTPGVYDDPKMSSEEAFFGNQNTTEIFSQSAENVKPRYFGASYSSVNTMFLDQLTNVANQDLDPDKAWDEVLEQVEKELSR